MDFISNAAQDIRRSGDHYVTRHGEYDTYEEARLTESFFHFASTLGQD